ncbi:retrovirus-related pol polyprotein from transposon TNT 1-94 [Tanacetum coccineum]|uniref:Retrovirus-related pol polyprotein from transposon TNT 1-94 n=1 Tax=Tanacetum coccineum TaxID=301880 RepID=A0ABQ5AN54_9ASTR
MKLLILTFTGLDEFVNKTVVKNKKTDEEVSKVVRKSDDSPIIEDWVSDSEEENVSQPKIEKKIVKPSVAKIEFVKPKQQEKTARKNAKQVEQHRQNTYIPRGNQRNWNNMMSQKLGSNFEMFNKACYVCGSFDHLQVDCNNHQKQFQNQRMVKPVWNNAKRVNHQNFAKKTHPYAKKNLVPRAVLIKSGLVLVNTARQVNTAHSKTTVNAARPMSYLSKTAHSTIKRPIHKNTAFKNSNIDQRVNTGNPQIDLQDQGVIDSGCSRHMTGNMSYLTDYEEIDGGYVAFGGNPKGGKITGKCTIKTGNLDFENVYFVRELKFNLFSVSQMYDKKNSVLFNDTGCIVLSPNFKLIDESQVLLRVPRKNNMYSVDLKNIVPKGGLTCLFAKATSNESKLWHRRLGHLNFKTMNKLVKGNLVRGFLPNFLKMMKPVLLVKRESSTEPLDETSGILKAFINGIENLVDHNVKVIRCDNGIEFKNREMNQFCEMKGILRQFSVARTPQQNEVAERRNMTLIEAARTMLADSKLPTTFWAEAVNTRSARAPARDPAPANILYCYLFKGFQPCTTSAPVRSSIDGSMLGGISSTIVQAGARVPDWNRKVCNDLKLESVHVVGCPDVVVQAVQTQVVQLRSTPSVVGSGPNWLFDIDALTRTMNYEPIVAGTQSNGFAGTKASDNADPKSSHDDESKPLSDDGKKVDEDPRKDSKCNDQEKKDYVNSTNNVNAASINEVNVVGGKTSIELPFDPDMPALEDYSIFDFTRDDEDDGVVADMNNLDTTIQVSHIPTTRIHKDHPLDQVIGDLQSATQTRNMSKNLKEHGFVSTIQQRTNHKDLQNCLFACFLSQEDPKKVIHALKDPSWIEAMQEELLQFKLQEVWTLVDLPNGKRVICTKRRIDYNEVFATIARIEAIRLFLAYDSFKDFMVYQMDVKSAFLYGKIEEDFSSAPRAWYETLSTYLLDNGFQRGKIDKTLFIKRHKGDILLVQVYVDDIIFGSTKKELCNAFEKLMHEKFQMSSMGELTFFLGLQVQQKKDDIFISQDKYVVEILKKFGFTEVKTASTPMETQKPLLKDEDGEEVDVHMYRSMIGSLMYLTSSRLDILFAVCACARYQVNIKVSHLNAVKRIFGDYTGASLDRKSITRGCQFLGCRLISWQCNKQIVGANCTIEAEYVAASNMAPLPPHEQRHPFLRYQGLEYTDEDHADFEERLERIYGHEIHRVQVVYFQGMPELMRDVLFPRMRMEHRDDADLEREEMDSLGFARYWSESERMIPRKGDLHDYWRSISTDGDFLGTEKSIGTHDLRF